MAIIRTIKKGGFKYRIKETVLFLYRPIFFCDESYTSLEAEELTEKFFKTSFNIIKEFFN